MGDYNASTLDNPANAPAGTWGNVYKAEGQVTIPAAASAGATVDFITLPRGTRVIDAKAIFDGAATGATTMNLGLKGKTGTTQDNATYFLSAAALNTASLSRQDQVVTPVTLDEEHYVRGVTAAAAPGAATVVTVVVLYEYVGTK